MCRRCTWSPPIWECWWVASPSPVRSLHSSSLRGGCPRSRFTSPDATPSTQLFWLPTLLPWVPSSQWLLVLPSLPPELLPPTLSFRLSRGSPPLLLLEV